MEEDWWEAQSAVQIYQDCVSVQNHAKWDKAAQSLGRVFTFHHNLRWKGALFLAKIALSAAFYHFESRAYYISVPLVDQSKHP